MILLRTIVILMLALPAYTYGATSEDVRNDDIEIVEGKDRTIYEYRTNGVLMMIKVVPKKGRPYYMVPADGSPHYEGIDRAETLYPRWIILEW
ncbi:MAG: DUF2782 domain-containing protein [Pseudomonadales bacterium]